MQFGIFVLFVVFDSTYFHIVDWLGWNLFVFTLQKLYFIGFSVPRCDGMHEYHRRMAVDTCSSSFISIFPMRYTVIWSVGWHRYEANIMRLFIYFTNHVICYFESCATVSHMKMLNVFKTFVPNCCQKYQWKQYNQLTVHSIISDNCLKGKQRQRFGDMGLIGLRKTNNFQPQSHL